VRRGLAREEFAAVGTNGPPRVTLTGPRGQTLSTPTRADHMAIGKQGMALSVSGSRTTYFVVPHPQAGRWTITPEPGATIPARYEYALPLRPLGLKARVLGRGHRRTLHWRFAAQRGVSVEFLQAGGTEERIVRSSRGSGRARFTVSPGPGGRRQVLAIVSVDGFPRERLAVGRFVAPKPVLPRVAHASYHVRRGTLSVRWTAVRRAAYYQVAIRFNGSVATYRVRGVQGRMTLRLAKGQRVRSVSVTVLVGGIHGPAVRAKKK